MNIPALDMPASQLNSAPNQAILTIKDILNSEDHKEGTTSATILSEIRSAIASQDLQQGTQQETIAATPIRSVTFLIKNTGNGFKLRDLEPTFQTLSKLLTTGSPKMTLKISITRSLQGFPDGSEIGSEIVAVESEANSDTCPVCVFSGQPEQGKLGRRTIKRARMSTPCPWRKTGQRGGTVITARKL